MKQLSHGGLLKASVERCLINIHGWGQLSSENHHKTKKEQQFHLSTDAPLLKFLTLVRLHVRLACLGICQSLPASSDRLEKNEDFMLLLPLSSRGQCGYLEEAVFGVGERCGRGRKVESREEKGEGCRCSACYRTAAEEEEAE